MVKVPLVIGIYVIIFYECLADSNKLGSSVAAEGGGDGGDDNPPQPQPDDIEDNRPMTDDELFELSCNINRLTGPHLGTIIDIVQSRQPELTTVNNEFVLDFYEMKPSTLRAIERYVTPLINNE